MKYSVLMSVYNKEKADNLRAAMDSIWNQTYPTDDFILVCDGPLSNELNIVIDDMLIKHANMLNVIRLDNNMGLGNALNIGIKACKHELIARMDSDDISREDRCERQIKVFVERPEVGISSGIVEEFINSKDEICSIRIPPEYQDEIVMFSKQRNPFNHPCVMYKKSAVEAAGGYQDFYLLEDYFLWVRMLQNGTVGYNLQEPLLWMRVSTDFYKRRSGWNYVKSQRRLFKYMKDSGFINRNQYTKAVFIRTVSSITPNRIRRVFFNSILRKR